MTKIVGREVSPINKISWVPAEGSFPMKYSISGNRLAGALALLIGSVWVSFFVDDIFKAMEPTFFLPELLMLILVTLPGIFVLIYGISQNIYYEETTVDQNSILWKRRGLTGNREWLETISNYQGVLKEHQYRSRDDVSRRENHMIYFIRLVHSDSGKEVVLYRAESSMLVPPTDWLEKWKRYAELFQLPVIEKTESGMSSSNVEDIEKPLVNKISEGKLKISPIDPMNADLGFMAKLTRDNDLWVITVYPVWNAWKSIAGVIILVIALISANSLEIISPQVSKYFLCFIPVCVIVIALSIRRQVAHPEQLALDKQSIYYRYFKKQAERVTYDIPLHSIYNISVKSDPMHFRTSGDIVIEAKNKCIRFGWWLPKKTKLHIKSLLLSLIANVLSDR
jgi:hypothetical protein